MPAGSAGACGAAGLDLWLCGVEVAGLLCGVDVEAGLLWGVELTSLLWGVEVAGLLCGVDVDAGAGAGAATGLRMWGVGASEAARGVLCGARATAGAGVLCTRRPGGVPLAGSVDTRGPAAKLLRDRDLDLLTETRLG